MSAIQHDTPMVRKQYHLSVANVRRVSQLRAELGLDSEAELIRRAIDTFDPDALDATERELVEETAEDLLERLHTLNADIQETLDRARDARDRISDPNWIESIRERTRQEAARDPRLVAGVAAVFGVQ